jgi:hypothetical protein
LISRARAALAAAVLIIATAAITAIVVTKWDNLFPPTDYEDCAARAAKDAKSKDSLSVLLSLCDSEFKGRRKPGGGYAYYNSCSGRYSDIGRTFDIKGPNPTPDEQKYMSGQCLADMRADREAAEQEAEAARKRAEQEAEAARQAAEQRAEAARKAQLAVAYQAAQEQAAAAAAANALQLRKSQTIPAVHVTVNGFECAGLYYENSCTSNPYIIYMQLEVTNQSKEALSSILIGLAVAPTNGKCPSSYAETNTLRIPLSSGESRVTKILSDRDFLNHPVCIKVMDVQFAGDAQAIPLR